MGNERGPAEKTSIRHRARVAGVLYFLLAASAPFGLMYVPGKLIVPGNAAATAEAIRASPSLLRAGIASELVHQVLVIFLVLALYRLFREVDDMLAKQVVILGALVSVPIVFVNILNDVAALALALGGPGDYLSVFDGPQRDALAYFFLHLHGQGITVASVFWGLWLFPFGLLVIRSGFIPRIFGYLLLIAGFGYLLAAFSTLVLPSWEPVVSKVAFPLEVAEVPIIFWLLIWGAKPREGAAARG